VGVVCVADCVSSASVCAILSTPPETPDGVLTSCLPGVSCLPSVSCCTQIAGLSRESTASCLGWGGLNETIWSLSLSANICKQQFNLNKIINKIISNWKYFIKYFYLRPINLTDSSVLGRNTWYWVSVADVCWEYLALSVSSRRMLRVPGTECQ